MANIEFVKVTNKYIDEKLNVLDITDESREFLKNKLWAGLRKRKLFLKDLNAINFMVTRSMSTGRTYWDIAVYTKNSYFCIRMED